MDIIKIGTIELSGFEAERLYESGKRYLVTYSKIYALDYSVNAGYHGRLIYKRQEKGGFTRRGRFFAYPASEVNHLLGFKLLQED